MPVPANYAQWRGSISGIQSVTSLLHDTCLSKQFSIVFYIIRDTGNVPVVPSPANISQCIANLNTVFSRICVSFTSCSTVMINNYTHNDWRIATTESMVTNNFNTPNTINIYLPRTILSGQMGYTYPPNSNPKRIIVLEKNLLTTNTLSASVIHEMGHFFGLVHTSDEIGLPVTPAPPVGVTSFEFVNGNNCATNGDGICDTEADCFPLPNGTRDGNNEYYVRPIDNFMSNVTTSRCRFTQMQYNLMSRVILTQLLFLH
jgi:hypothetical protein